MEDKPAQRPAFLHLWKTRHSSEIVLVQQMAMAELFCSLILHKELLVISLKHLLLLKWKRQSRPPSLFFWKVKIHLDFIVLATIFTLANVIKTDIIARGFISQGKDLHLLDWASADLTVFMFGSVISTGSYEVEWVEDSLTLWKICFWDSFEQYWCLFFLTIVFVFLFSGYCFDLHNAHCKKNFTLNGQNASRGNENKPTEDETYVVIFLRSVGI